jgi:hypothetical protein
MLEIMSCGRKDKYVIKMPKVITVRIAYTFNFIENFSFIVKP